MRYSKLLLLVLLLPLGFTGCTTLPQPPPARFAILDIESFPNVTDTPALQ